MVWNALILTEILCNLDLIGMKGWIWGGLDLTEIVLDGLKFTKTVWDDVELTGIVWDDFGLTVWYGLEPVEIS